jgi:hypothetical protein
MKDTKKLKAINKKEIKKLLRIMFNNYMLVNGVMAKTIFRNYNLKKRRLINE